MDAGLPGVLDAGRVTCGMPPQPMLATPARSTQELIKKMQAAAAAGVGGSGKSKGSSASAAASSSSSSFSPSCSSSSSSSSSSSTSSPASVTACDFTAEFKYDGQRAQIHALPDGSIRIYSRKLDDMTTKYVKAASPPASLGL